MQISEHCQQAEPSTQLAAEPIASWLAMGSSLGALALVFVLYRALAQMSSKSKEMAGSRFVGRQGCGEVDPLLLPAEHSLEFLPEGDSRQDACSTHILCLFLTTAERQFAAASRVMVTHSVSVCSFVEIRRMRNALSIHAVACMYSRIVFWSYVLFSACAPCRSSSASICNGAIHLPVHSTLRTMGMVKPTL